MVEVAQWIKDHLPKPKVVSPDATPEQINAASRANAGDGEIQAPAAVLPRITGNVVVGSSITVRRRSS